ncbi:hypothetical protein [Apibacter sp. HY039]|uniref:hypothetical protein n=1 Tax=Apibacter sp. HY039 TaxID=2501476 RepID=UPI000FEBAD24|nr:hypothetical protein [Apibacter sp. HY039]
MFVKTDMLSYCEKTSDKQASKKDTPVSKKNSSNNPLNEEEHDDQKKISYHSQIRSERLSFNLSESHNLFLQLSKYQIYREIPSPPPNFNYFS